MSSLFVSESGFGLRRVLSQKAIFFFQGHFIPFPLVMVVSFGFGWQQFGQFYPDAFILIFFWYSYSILSASSCIPFACQLLFLSSLSFLDHDFSLVGRKTHPHIGILKPFRIVGNVFYRPNY